MQQQPQNLWLKNNVLFTLEKRHLPFAALPWMQCIDDGPGVSKENRCADVCKDFGVEKWDRDMVFSSVGTGEAVDAPERVIEEDSKS